MLLAWVLSHCVRPSGRRHRVTAEHASCWRAGALCAVVWGQGVLGTLTPEFFQRAVAQLESKGLGEFEPQVGWLAIWQAQLVCHPLLLTAVLLLLLQRVHAALSKQHSHVHTGLAVPAILPALIATQSASCMPSAGAGACSCCHSRA